MKFVPTNNWGVVIGGADALEVDTIGATLLQRSFSGPMISLMDQYSEVFASSPSFNHDLVPQKYNIDLKEK